MFTKAFWPTNLYAFITVVINVKAFLPHDFIMKISVYLLFWNNRISYCLSHIPYGPHQGKFI